MLSEKIYMLRKKSGLSQEQLAEKLGCRAILPGTFFVWGIRRLNDFLPAESGEKTDKIILAEKTL